MSTKLSPELKTALHHRCQAAVQARITDAQDAMEAAQAAANENTKSSAGDKYETGRAMMQLERDKAAAHLATAVELLEALDGIKPEKRHAAVQMGSLVRTAQGVFYLAAPIGKVEVEGAIYWAISPVSPVGKLLMGKSAGDEISFNGRTFEIVELV